LRAADANEHEVAQPLEMGSATGINMPYVVHEQFQLYAVRRGARH